MCQVRHTSRSSITFRAQATRHAPSSSPFASFLTRFLCDGPSRHLLRKERKKTKMLVIWRLPVPILRWLSSSDSSRRWFRFVLFKSYETRLTVLLQHLGCSVVVLCRLDMHVGGRPVVTLLFCALTGLILPQHLLCQRKYRFIFPVDSFYKLQTDPDVSTSFTLSPVYLGMSSVDDVETSENRADYPLLIQKPECTYFNKDFKNISY